MTIASRTSCSLTTCSDPSTAVRSRWNHHCRYGIPGTAARRRPDAAWPAPTDGRGVLGTRVRAIGAVLGVLGVGFGFLLEKSLDPVSLDLHVLLPYVAAIAGTVLWTAPPRPRPAPAQDAGTDA